MTKEFIAVPWTSSITEVKQDRLATHGVDQNEIIRSFSYEEMVYFLLKGSRPTRVERELLRAVLVSHISHGISGQSTLAVMEAADCRSDFLHALIGGFSVGSGMYHQGCLRATMQGFEKMVKIPPEELEDYLLTALDNREPIMGYGHRFHHRDPRAIALVQLADEYDFSGPHLELAMRIEKILYQAKGLAMNIEAVGGGILLDLGFDSRIGHLFVILGRSPMFAAVYLERLAQNRRPFQRIEVRDLLDPDE